MKNIVVGIAVLIWTLHASAEIVKSKIQKIDEGKNGEPHLVFMEDGHVAFLEFDKRVRLNDLYAFMQSKNVLEFDINDDHALLSFKEASPTSDENHITAPPLKDGEFSPSVVSTKNASNIFTRMRRDYRKGSQCFNRAHTWVHEEFVKKGTNLSKVFLFFTSSYIRKYKFGWWFHVTPMVYVGGTNNSNMRMLDRRYMKGPRTSKAWTDYFIKSKQSCKVTTNYFDYENYKGPRHCFMIPVSMYYYVPSDLANRDENQVQRTDWDELELEEAMLDGFGKQYRPNSMIESPLSTF